MQKKHEDAEKYYKQALAEAKKGFGEQDPHVGAACNNMAEHYRLTKQWQLARPMYDEVTPSSLPVDCWNLWKLQPLVPFSILA